ncbi:site-specific DNA-methyltransferase, partial [Arthrobacter sp. SDTb3-6]|uniref:site-specific DNA-methyltransferase n=1 Tax=Arthrobacter sp. SDTb3-6 TaxID=2713571 RepID=UPI00159DCB43|nr:site-specific DNA-methyltransferase [Arthrobacter sp. SDTb3-6]
MSDHALKINQLAAEHMPDRVSELAQLFPEAMTDGRIDVEKLRLLLGEQVEDSQERYGLTWPGKRDAIRLAQKQSTATLEPMPGESVDWVTTKNVIIEGDNLEVLKLLQKSYYGKIKLIYIDPPYNTGNDFVYNDDFAEPTNAYLKRSGQTDNAGFRTSINRETSGRFHSDWLNMMYSRLTIARNILAEDGVLLMSLDDNELSNASLLLKEVFGESDFVTVLPWKSRTAKSDVPFGISVDHEWILICAKKKFMAGRPIGRRYYNSVDTGELWRLQDLRSNKTRYERPNSYFELIDPKTGESYAANPNRTWSITPETFDGYYERGKIVFPGDYEFLNIGAPMFRVFKSEDEIKSLKKYGTTRPM